MLLGLKLPKNCKMLFKNVILTLFLEIEPPKNFTKTCIDNFDPKSG